jgi:hypothetical protein
MLAAPARVPVTHFESALNGIQGGDATWQTQGSTGYTRWKAAGSDRDGQSSYPLQGRASLPRDQAAVRLSEDQAARPDQEPLQNPHAGSTIESVPGPKAVARNSLSRGLVWLKRAIQPQEPAQSG